MSERDEEALASAPLDVMPIERDTLHQQVYERLRQAIVSGAIVPGTALSVRGLSRALGTSPMPVREALRRLIAERALEVLPNRSVILPLPSAARFAEIRRLRIAIEGMMVEAAAGSMAVADCDWLEQAEAAMEAAEQGPPADYLALHYAFHFRIYQAAAMPTALAITESLWLQTGPMLHHVMGRHRLGVARGQHKAIIAALRRHDGAAARAALAADIQDPGEEILGILRRLEEAA
jgi:DNA-binding GntR family transcriptional regulator